ncbi:MmgE/PrpD family protein [Rhizobium wuzhouense]|uniref:MmgE/PrpD family protein n=1 Tax=Rhizobium wuzhouense TaxID=1986026 RepID=A0ABX5NN04_9HYPH|nr:MmgE/PrpD family protein [Rhizobium wuzhouense]PYB70217.1 MmgE/PrpD family protein [Rhizobium wuzhouense]
MSLALELATRAGALDFERFDPEAIKWAKQAMADMVGCALLGANTDTTTMAIEAGAFPPGNCLVLGRKMRLGKLEAAFVNGTSGHALDYDDTSKSLSGHPTVIIVPGLLALAEELGSTGRDFVDAYIVGVETATRMARGLNFYHYEKGWHPTATLGIFGAIAAAARLMRLSEKQMADALCIGASLACGVKANFGTPVKPMHAGLAARNGLFAALLAQEGFEASPTALEGKQGFLEVFNGAGNYNVDKMLDGWARPLDLLEPGISIKKYPCVYSVHGAIDAAIALQAAIKPADVESVMVRMHPRRMLPHVLNPATSALNAKFSLSYAVSRALVNGAVTLDHFEDDALHDTDVVRIMNLIQMKPLEDLSHDYGAEVTVTLKDGSTLTNFVAAPLGRGPEVPMPETMLAAKFLDCADRAVTRQSAQTVFEMLMALDTLPSMRDLTAEINAGTLK